MPKPYLLVAQIPSEPGNGSGGGADNSPRKHLAKNAGSGLMEVADASPPAQPKPKDGDQTKKGNDQTGTTGGSSPTSDLSYQLGNTTYMLKLIYLPDMSKSMAITIKPSILGTSSMQPTLQDGWMLTSLSASADNTKALADFTTLATSLVGGGAKAAGGAGLMPSSAAALATPSPDDLVLPPGLYEFEYNQFGHLVGLCTVTVFTKNERVTNKHYCPTMEAISTLNWVRARG
jgi:hypothetical protein